MAMEVLASDAVDARLSELETVIDRGRKSFIEVGQALAEIRESRLYRKTHTSFDDYCRERWGFSRQRSYQLIEAANVVEGMSTHVDRPMPVNEGQVRQLARIDDADTRKAVWETVVVRDGENATAKDVKAVVDAVIEARPVSLDTARQHRDEERRTAMDDVMARSPTRQVAEDRAYWANAIKQAANLLAITPSHFVPLLDADARSRARQLAGQLRGLASAIELSLEQSAARPVAVVGGVQHEDTAIS